MKIEYKTIWSNGTLEFDDDISLKEYYDENPPQQTEEFTKLQKIIVKQE